MHVCRLVIALRVYSVSPPPPPPPPPPLGVACGNTRKSAHPLFGENVRFSCPWALFHESTVYCIAGYFRKCKISYKCLKCLQQKFSFFNCVRCHAPYNYMYVMCPWYVRCSFLFSVEAMHNDYGERVPCLPTVLISGPCLRENDE